ncbi:MAG: isoprenyl transferase [Prevotella sp.]|nr:isoprenyl transferase [Prevotella sp.]MCM1074247.1 isoprenyl transferase [Ruminococcus sp.]
MADFNEKIKKLDPAKVPLHVAIIMDGNGRWAKQRGLDRSFGHLEGVKAVRLATEFASDYGVKYLTLYAFSTENWHRPQPEVDALMHLIGTTIKAETPMLLKNNVQVRIIGDFSRLPKEARDNLSDSMKETAHCTGMKLILSLSYSGRDEILRAAKQLAQECADGKINAGDIDEDAIAARLDTRDFPNPDLLIRTGGEHRVSNFLIWQCAYSEMYFSPTLWPDFGKEAFLDALLDYQNRERRFGKTSDQINTQQ